VDNTGERDRFWFRTEDVWLVDVSIGPSLLPILAESALSIPGAGTLIELLLEGRLVFTALT
jgi:hypothetical protein